MCQFILERFKLIKRQLRWEFDEVQSSELINDSVNDFQTEEKAQLSNCLPLNLSHATLPPTHPLSPGSLTQRRRQRTVGNLI